MHYCIKSDAIGIRIESPFGYTDGGGWCVICNCQIISKMAMSWWVNSPTSKLLKS